ncbi:hypothetical protein GQ457_13G030330 [Hibiscus cannabinus]
MVQSHIRVITTDKSVIHIKHIYDCKFELRRLELVKVNYLVKVNGQRSTSKSTVKVNGQRSTVKGQWSTGQTGQTGQRVKRSGHGHGSGSVWVQFSLGQLVHQSWAFPPKPEPTLSHHPKQHMPTQLWASSLLQQHKGIIPYALGFHKPIHSGDGGTTLSRRQPLLRRPPNNHQRPKSQPSPTNPTPNLTSPTPKLHCLISKPNPP